MAEKQHRGEVVPPTAPYQVLWKTRLPGSVISVQSTPNCSLSIAASVDRSASLLDAEGGVLWSERVDDEGWASSIAADGSRIAIGTANKSPAAGSVFIYDRQGAQIWRQSFPAPVWSVSLSHDGSLLALSRWDGIAMTFVEEGGSYQKTGESHIGEAGLYGIAISEDSGTVAIAVYDSGIVFTDAKFSSIRHIPLPTGFYNLRFVPGRDEVCVGTRDGGVIFVEVHTGTVRTFPTISARPICGVAASTGGYVVAAGSFDGSVYILNREGQPLWSFAASGEVWSVDLSRDGSLAVLATGDGLVQLVRNLVTGAAVQELMFQEQRLMTEPRWVEQRAVCASLENCYLRYGLVEYGTRRLLELLGADSSLARESARRILEADVQAHPSHVRAWYLLAGLQSDDRNWYAAAKAYLKAARGKDLRMESLLRAGQSFQNAGLETAALSCLRRSREQELIDNERRVLFNLARSYEDAGQSREARKHYEVLFSDEPDYRDVESRLLALSKGIAQDRFTQREADYTGLTVSLLGPDVPRINDVDQRLRPVLAARAKELSVSAEERTTLRNELKWLSDGGLIGCERPVLSYDELSYLRYDNLLPEDEIKKLLELLNLLCLTREITPLACTLDIGTATGRHPMIMRMRGANAYGVDVEPRAIEYAIKKTQGLDRLAFQVADGRSLPFEDEKFDLITCMMGTIAHVPTEDQERIAVEALRCLRPGGKFVASTWDIECRHLSFLSMYTHDERELIRTNSLPQAEISQMLHKCGYVELGIRPFIMLPDVFSYELGVQRLDEDDVVRLLEIDLATRATFPDTHGEMFLAFGSRPA